MEDEEFEDDTEFRLTEEGLESLLHAYDLYLAGHSHVEIEEMLGLKGEADDLDPDYKPGGTIQVLFAIGNHTGILDEYERMKSERGQGIDWSQLP